MAIKKIVLLIMLISNLANCQTKQISFSYNSESYKKIAFDSIKVLYDRQKEYYTKNKAEIDKEFYDKAISLNYKFEDLDFFIIPKYRLYRETETKYTCKSDIEDFIVFNESGKYFTALILVEDKICSSSNVPNNIFEYQRIYTPDVYTVHLGKKESYLRNYLNEFTSYNTAHYNIVKDRPGNFFFELYGLNGVIFEIDKISGLLFANYFGMFIDEYEVPRMLANEFIRKYVGKKIIIELAKGNYKDIDGTGSLIEYKPCPESRIEDDNRYLKVNYE